MKKIIFILYLFNITYIYAFENIEYYCEEANTFSIMKRKLENEKEKLLYPQRRRTIFEYKQELIKIRNGLDKILLNLIDIKNRCYDDYNDSIISFKRIRDNNIQKYPHMEGFINDKYDKDIKDKKNELKYCLISRCNFLVEIIELKDKLKYTPKGGMKESSPKLEKILVEINKKISEINELK